MIKPVNMKRKLTMCLVLVLMVVGARAQGFRFGLSGGLNESAYSWDGYTSGWKTGIHAGIFGEVLLSRKIGIEADLLYSQKGGHYNPDSSFDYTQRFNYLNLPVLFNFHLTHRLVVQAGPEIGLLLAAGAKSAAGVYNNKQLYRSFDKGVAGGVFYQLPKGFDVGIRYIQGFKPISKVLYLTDFNGNLIGSGSFGNNMTAQLTVHYTLFSRKV